MPDPDGDSAGSLSQQNLQDRIAQRARIHVIQVHQHYDAIPCSIPACFSFESLPFCASAAASDTTPIIKTAMARKNRMELPFLESETCIPFPQSELRGG